MLLGVDIMNEKVRRVNITFTFEIFGVVFA